MKIEHCVCINDSFLMVFYQDSFWQYAIIFDDLTRYCPTEIYFSSAGAYRQGREALTSMLGI